MNTREFYEAVLNNEANSVEVREMAHALIEKLNARNTNRKPTAKQLENEKLKEDIMVYMADDGRPHPAPEIAAEMEISIQRASALLTQLENAGKLHSEERKIDKAKKKVYMLVEEEEG